MQRWKESDRSTKAKSKKSLIGLTGKRSKKNKEDSCKGGRQGSGSNKHRQVNPGEQTDTGTQEGLNMTVPREYRELTDYKNTEQSGREHGAGQGLNTEENR